MEILSYIVVGYLRHPACKNDTNGLEPGSNSKMTDKHAAEYSKTIYRRVSAIMFYLHFLNFLSVIYRWNRNKMFYLLSSSDVAYLDCVDIYKAFNFAASPKIECYNVLSPF